MLTCKMLVITVLHPINWNNCHKVRLCWVYCVCRSASNNWHWQSVGLRLIS